MLQSFQTSETLREQVERVKGSFVSSCQVRRYYMSTPEKFEQEVLALIMSSSISWEDKKSIIEFLIVRGNIYKLAQIIKEYPL